MMKRLLCILLVSLLFTSAMAEGVLAPGWEEQSLQALENARTSLDQRIAELRTEAIQAAQKAAEEAGEIKETLFDLGGVYMEWNGLGDSNTSGMDFKPLVVITNQNAEKATVLLGDVYVNHCLMGVSNSGTISLEPGETVNIAKEYKWLIGATNLIDVYGYRHITSLDMKLTVRVGNEVIAQDMTVHRDLDMDLFAIMSGNSYFTKRYAMWMEPQPADHADDLVIYEDPQIRVLWSGLVDTHTTGMDIKPVVFIDNHSDERVSVSFDQMYINDRLMSVSNAGALEVEPGCCMDLTVKNKWLIGTADLLNVYGFQAVDKFTAYMTIKCGGQLLASSVPVVIEPKADLFKLMAGNSTFVKRYPAGYMAVTPDYDSMAVIYEDETVRFLWHGLADTHTTGMNYQPAVFIQNKSDKAVTVTPNEFYVNGYKVKVSNSSGIKLQRGTAVDLVTLNRWLLSAAEMIDEHDAKVIDQFKMIYTIKSDDRTIVSEQAFVWNEPIDLYEVMKDNSTFAKKYVLEQ